VSGRGRGETGRVADWADFWEGKGGVCRQDEILRSQQSTPAARARDGDQEEAGNYGVQCRPPEGCSKQYQVISCFFLSFCLCLLSLRLFAFIFLPCLLFPVNPVSGFSCVRFVFQPSMSNAQCKKSTCAPGAVTSVSLVSLTK
jgi:hypothetical protein